MTVRILVRIASYAEMGPDGGHHLHSFRTFDVEAPALEALLRTSDYGHRQHVEVIGAELLPADQGGAQ